MIITPHEFTEAMDFVEESSKQIKRYAKTLIKNLQLNYFAHIRVREKISMSGLATRVDPAPEWMNYSMPIPIPSKPGLYIASSFPEIFPVEKLEVFKNSYGFGHIAFYVTHYREYSDIFAFCADPDNPRVINNYANHYNKMVNFASQFRHDARCLIKTVERRHPYIYKQNSKSHEILTINECADDVNSHSKNLDSALIKEYENYLLNLSPRELQCLSLAAQGYTAKESTSALGLSSYKSVEGYLENAKNKLGCYGPGGKRQMVALFKVITRT